MVPGPGLQNFWEIKDVRTRQADSISAGLAEVSRPSPRRVVMRVDFTR
jgi:hypothetical protein